MKGYGSRLVQAGRITLTIDGVETDRFVCGFVEVFPCGTRLDGYPQVMMNGEAYDIDLLDMPKRDVDRIEQLLIDTAIAEVEDEYSDTDPDEYDDSWERDCA